MRRPSMHMISAVAVVTGLLATSFLSGQEKAIVSIEANTAIGIVDDIVLDDYGNVDYLLVINPDGKLVTVPWDAAQFNPEKRVAYVPITPERFRAVPTYS